MDEPETSRGDRFWSGWNGVGTVAVTLVGSIACFTRVGQPGFALRESPSSPTLVRLAVSVVFINGTIVTTAMAGD